VATGTGFTIINTTYKFANMESHKKCY
jgi:hypothetical protein